MLYLQSLGGVRKSWALKCLLTSSWVSRLHVLLSPGPFTAAVSTRYSRGRLLLFLFIRTNVVQINVALVIQ